MANNGGYSSSEIISMQNDAVRRVNEMQRLARERVGNVASTPQSIQQPATQQEPLHTPTPPPPSTSLLSGLGGSIEGIGNSFAGILDKLDLDSEKILIILLMIVLVNEGADILVILALGYILMAP